MSAKSISPSVAKSKAHSAPLTQRLIVGYARTNHGGAEEISRQRAVAEAYSRKAYRRPLDAFYEDTDGRHGLRLNGPSMNELVELVRKGVVDVVVVDHVDRLSRSIGMLQQFAALCRNHSTEIHQPGCGKLALEPLLPVHADVFTAQIALMRRERAAARRLQAKATRALAR